MSISMKDFKLPLFTQAGQLKSAKERAQRRQTMTDQVAALENQKANLKNRECDTLEEIGEKLETYYTYESEIAAIKKSYNMAEAMHVMDEAEERGEQIAEAAEKTKPKTREERRRDAIEEATGTEQSLLTKLLEENVLEEDAMEESAFFEEFDFAANRDAIEDLLDITLQNQPISYLQEMEEVCRSLREIYAPSDGVDSFTDSVTRMAQAYAQVSKRIDEEFDDPDRVLSYVTDEDGKLVEETRERRKEQLTQAYDLYATFVAASKRIMTELRQRYHGELSGLDSKEVQENTYRAYQDAIGERNLMRMQEHGTDIRNCKLDFSIGQEWMDILSQIGKRD